ncbi:hypothetical protein [Butyrivibrio sp. AE2032]|uniref:hypothetical protein n=1 Tax=Butyrivibrio sp. AE2032 TaxID=1458463 RepID=UPI00054E49BA|nr:hypothetical protein [Butyrivibrio sp. AE2032]
MEIIELDADNIEDYEEYIGQDISENIGREFYRGIVASEDGFSPSGAMVWEYKNMEEDGDTNAEIFYVNSDSEEATEALLQAFDDQTSDEDVVRSFFEVQGMSDDVFASFLGDGFDVENVEGRDLIVTVSDLSMLAEKAKKLPAYVVELDRVMEVDFMQGMINCAFHGKKGMLEDLNYIEKDWFEGKVSCCTVHDGKISGMLLIHALPSEKLMPVLMVATGPEGQKDVLHMVLFAAKRAVENYPGDTMVLIRRHDKNVTALSAKLFAGKNGEVVTRGNRG